MIHENKDGDFMYTYEDDPFFTEVGGHRLWTMNRCRHGRDRIALVDQSGESPLDNDDARDGHGPLLVDASPERPMCIVMLGLGGGPKVQLPLVGDRSREELHATVSMSLARAVSAATGEPVTMNVFDGSGRNLVLVPDATVPAPDWSLQRMAQSVDEAQNAVNLTAVAATFSGLTRALHRRLRSTDDVRAHTLTRCMASKIESLTFRATGEDWAELDRLNRGDIDGLDQLGDALAVVATTKQGE